MANLLPLTCQRSLWTAPYYTKWDDFRRRCNVRNFDNSSENFSQNVQIWSRIRLFATLTQHTIIIQILRLNMTKEIQRASGLRPIKLVTFDVELKKTLIWFSVVLKCIFYFSMMKNPDLFDYDMIFLWSKIFSIIKLARNSFSMMKNCHCDMIFLKMS